MRIPILYSTILKCIWITTLLDLGNGIGLVENKNIYYYNFFFKISQKVFKYKKKKILIYF